jgi:ubiquinone biosynthesis protein UbiJ
LGCVGTSTTIHGSIARREDVSDRLRSLTTGLALVRPVAELTTKVAAVDRLQRDVQQLQRRVDALERQPPAPSPTATPKPVRR